MMQHICALSNACTARYVKENMTRQQMPLVASQQHAETTHAISSEPTEG
jgi:hypothetical protein